MLATAKRGSFCTKVILLIDPLGSHLLRQSRLFTLTFNPKPGNTFSARRRHCTNYQKISRSEGSYFQKKVSRAGIWNNGSIFAKDSQQGQHVLTESVTMDLYIADVPWDVTRLTITTFSCRE